MARWSSERISCTRSWVDEKERGFALCVGSVEAEAVDLGAVWAWVEATGPAWPRGLGMGQAWEGAVFTPTAGSIRGFLDVGGPWG